MSYLTLPRIGFVAHDAMTNPSTANNENVIHLLDYDNVKLLNPPVATNPDGARLPEMSPAAYREWMTTMITYSDPFDPHLQPGTQQGGEQGADWQPGMPGYWNYWGDHLTTFGSAQITSAWLDDEPVVDPAEDPLLGSRIIYNARIVDVDPADTFTTQFVCARFAVLGPDRAGEPAELFAGVLTTSFTRFLNFFRPKGAGSFQAVIPNDRLAVIDEDRAPDSAAFRALRDGCRAAGGLLVRHCLYAMSAASPMADMYERFQQGNPAANPKIGSVVGSLGVWQSEDLPATPVGRILHQPGPPFFDPSDGTDPRHHVKSHADVERVSNELATAANIAKAADPANVGPAVAVLDGDRVVLDLLTTFPEVGRPKVGPPPPDPLAKVDYGPVVLVLVDGDERIPLGRVAYDRRVYEQRAGVWEVPVPAEAVSRLASGWLQLETGDGTVLLREIDCTEIECEQFATYLDLAPPAEGQHPSARATVRLRAYTKGEPITEPVTVNVQRFHDMQVPGEINSVSPLVLTATQLDDEPVGDIDQIVIPAGGVFDLDVTAAEPGCFKLRFIPADMPPPPDGPNFAVEFFSSFRALPYHDYSHVTDEELTWQYVYEEVFEYYSILYPIMGSIIPWGPSNAPSDPKRVGQFAALIRQAVDASRLDTALQMPITRELSASKRALVQRWCDLQLRTS